MNWHCPFPVRNRCSPQGKQAFSSWFCPSSVYDSCAKINLLFLWKLNWQHWKKSGSYLEGCCMQTASQMSLSSHYTLQKYRLYFINDALYGQRTEKDTPMISVPFPFECAWKEEPPSPLPRSSSWLFSTCTGSTPEDPFWMVRLEKQGTWAQPFSPPFGSQLSPGSMHFPLLLFP